LTFPVGSVIDFEAIGDTGVLFDLLQLGNEDLRGLGALKRWQRLAGCMPSSDSIRLVRTAITTAEKRKLYDALRAERAEGVVFKRKDAVYTPGRPNSGGPLLKFKFVAM